MKKFMIVFALVLGLGLYGFIPQGSAQMGPGMMGPGYTSPGGPGQPGQWNYCPYCGRSLPKGGYGPGGGMMGGGMMNPGMMGRGGYGQGYGMMGPGMMGRGGYGQGYGPGYGMMGRGMMGGGMMGPGMMGRGGYGPGPGMMGPGGRQPYGPQYQEGRKALTEKDAKGILENYLKASRNPNLKLGKIEDKDNAFEASIITKKEGALVDRIAIDKRTGWMRSVY